MEPPPRSLALDAHYCIMVRVPHGPPNTSTRARSVALAGELPSVSTPCLPRPATGDAPQNRWPPRSLGRDEDMVVLQTSNEVKRPEPAPNQRLDRNHPIQVLGREIEVAGAELLNHPLDLVHARPTPARAGGPRSPLPPCALWLPA